MDLVAMVRRRVTESIEAKQRMLQDETAMESLTVAVNAIHEAVIMGRKVFVCGNGGSAADALHIAAEFTGRFRRDRRPYPAIALTGNTSAITAIANDYSFEEVFSRQVEAFATKGDILIALSTSGESRNVVFAARKAREVGAYVIALTGHKEGALTLEADVAIRVPATETSHIQECHMAVGHILAEVAELAMGDLA